jgi:hypothetical protein
MNAPAPTMNVPASAERSTLVSVLGWIAIVFGALGIYSSVAQMVFFSGLAEAPIPDVDPALQEVAFRSFGVMSVLSIALAGFLMCTGYALWKRRNWARRTFVVLFALGIASNVIWVAFSAMFGSLFAQFGAALGAIFVVFAIFALGMAALFAWLIKRLRSPAVKSEFV